MRFLFTFAAFAIAVLLVVTPDSVVAQSPVEEKGLYDRFVAGYGGAWWRGH